MQFIVDSLDFIINTVRSVWDFFTSLMDNMLMLVQYLGVVANICYDTIASMPDWIQAFGFLTIVVSVLYVILGRDTGGNKE